VEGEFGRSENLAECGGECGELVGVELVGEVLVGEVLVDTAEMAWGGLVQAFAPRVGDGDERGSAVLRVGFAGHQSCGLHLGCEPADSGAAEYGAFAEIGHPQRWDHVEFE
jgi:hypothetical protein